MTDDTPARKCTHEVKALIHRWEEESDLDDVEIIECLNTAIDEYYDEDVVEFGSDMDLGEDE